ncbi:MAG: ATP-binding protein [Gemmatimonadota bacterium]
MHFSTDDLVGLTILDGLPREHLDWFSEHGEKIELAPGQHMFDRGKSADSMWIVVEGLIQGFEEHGGQWLLVATTRRGEVTGMLPFSRMTHYPRHTVAAEPSKVLRVSVSDFPGMLRVSPEAGKRLVAEMTDRTRGDVRLEQQSEKMIALGRLSAGLAHELNNPASAVRRAATLISEQRERLPGLVMALVRQGVSLAALEGLERLRVRAKGFASAGLSAVEHADREEEIAKWLEGRGIENAWEMAATFADGGLTAGDLEEVARDVPVAGLPDAIEWLSIGLEGDRIGADIASASARISELIGAIKVYSHMDRSSEHKATDVRVGIGDTLTMLHHKIEERGIRVERDDQPDLPPIPANAGELNQVWTILIDNALDAMSEGGRLRVRTRPNDLWVEVEVEDDGPGIPEDIRVQIFEPFFTTKDVGIGTGLGLTIAHRIVTTHQGHIEVRSRPGETVMCVRLPIRPRSPVRPA